MFNIFLLCDYISKHNVWNDEKYEKTFYFLFQCVYIHIRFCASFLGEYTLHKD